MRAIETGFKGYRLRSRLEARWCVFFETLGLQWEYEPEGFDIDGVWYLPDFRVKTPQGEDTWYEVKPRGVEEDAKFSAFLNGGEAEPLRGFLLSGDPVDMLDKHPMCPRCGVFMDPRDYQDGPFAIYARCGYCDWETPSGGGHPLEVGFLGAQVRPHKGEIEVEPPYEWQRYMRDLVRPAALKARGARFEHGERG